MDFKKQPSFIDDDELDKELQEFLDIISEYDGTDKSKLPHFDWNDKDYIFKATLTLDALKKYHQ